MIIIIIGLIAVIIVLLITRPKNSNKYNIEPNIQENEIQTNMQNIVQTYYPYERKYILTKNEYYFYKKLKKYTDTANLQILTKIRLADLIEVKKGLPKNEWGMYFSKIKAKHIDFAIADDMNIIALIELDDSTHNRSDRIVRDNFVNTALTGAGYTVVRTSGDTKYIEHIINTYRNNYYNVPPAD